MITRVLHVLDTLGVGGIEMTFLHVLRAMRSCGDSTDVTLAHDLLAMDGGPLELMFREVCDAVFVCRRPVEIDRVLDRDYSVVHALMDRPAHRVLPRVMARGRAVTVYGKGYDLAATYRMEGAFKWSADEALLDACDAVTFTTRALARGYSVSPDRLTVLGKAVAFDRFSSIPDPSDDVPDRVVCVATLHPGKRVVDLLRTLPVIRAAVPDALLTVVGDDRGGERARLESVARCLGIAHAVEFTGLSLDVSDRLREARVAALPSHREGVPTALLEAMAAGRPVVATRVGHVQSVVDDGIEGYLVDVGNVASIADHIVRLLTDRALAARMGAAGRRRAAAHDVNLVARRLGDLLRVLGSRRRELCCA